MPTGKVEHNDAPPPSYGNVAGQPPPMYTGQPGASAPNVPPPQPAWAPPPQPYVPPPAGAPPPLQPQYPMGTNVSGTTTVLLAGAMGFRDQPVQMTCPHCSAHIVTTLNYSVGAMVWIVAAIIFFVGCWAGCCLIPFCINGLKDVDHICPCCQQTLGTYNRLN